MSPVERTIRTNCAAATVAPRLSAITFVRNCKGMRFLEPPALERFAPISRVTVRPSRGASASSRRPRRPRRRCWPPQRTPSRGPGRRPRGAVRPRAACAQGPEAAPPPLRESHTSAEGRRRCPLLLLLRRRWGRPGGSPLRACSSPWRGAAMTRATSGAHRSLPRPATPRWTGRTGPSGGPQAPHRPHRLPPPPRLPRGPCLRPRRRPSAP